MQQRLARGEDSGEAAAISGMHYVGERAGNLDNTLELPD
jgi:hypothetical protein